MQSFGLFVIGTLTMFALWSNFNKPVVDTRPQIGRGPARYAISGDDKTRRLLSYPAAAVIGYAILQGLRTFFRETREAFVPDSFEQEEHR